MNNPWGARTAVMISDIWQWTPFMFIVLLAALEGQDVETHRGGSGGRGEPLADIPQYHLARASYR